MQNKKSLVAYWAWGVVALFFFYQYILRVAPGVMIDDLRKEFQLTADQFSTLGSLYLYAYSLLQIPLGIVVDRVGVRRTVLVSIILCMAGGAMMALANEFWIVQVSRVLVGAGSGCAFMCALKVIADRLPPGKRGAFIGATLTLGTVGALVAGKPLVLMLDSYGWRNAMLIAVGLGVSILILGFVFLPKRAKNRPSLKDESLKSVALEVLGVIGNGRIMLYALLAVGLYTPLAAMADLWGTAFLMQKFDLTRVDAAQSNMMMYFGLAIGSLFLPWICEKYGKINLAIQICTGMVLFLFAALIYGPMLSPSSITVLLILLGLFCGAEMMCFTGALLFSDPNSSGRIIGVVNTLNMLGGAILQRIIGYALDFQWDGAFSESGIRVYSTQQFVNALTVLLVIVAVCALASIRLSKKRNLKSQLNVGV